MSKTFPCLLYSACMRDLSATQSAFTAMKNALVSRDPICIFSDNCGALVDKSIHTCAT